MLSALTFVTLAAAVAAGAIAAVAGFGIGSLLTPLLSLDVGAKTAIAAVSIPHLVGTTVRFWRLRAHVHRPLLWSFGLTSAAGGLTGALLHASVSSPILALVFGLILVFAGGSQALGPATRWRFHGAVAWAAGALSGFFGGLVGNQGGIRAASMLGFSISRDEFVATATAVALLVDLARMPVYLVSEGRAVAAMWPTVALATAGVVAGTFAGGWILARIPEVVFRRAVGVLIFLLGVAVLVRGRA